jgi:hypothetical protein
MLFLISLWHKAVAWVRNDSAFPQPKDDSYAPSEVIEQVRVPKKRKSGSKGGKTAKAGSRNRVQRQAKSRKR